LFRPRCLPSRPQEGRWHVPASSQTVRATRAGVVGAIDALAIGKAGVLLGAGRQVRLGLLALDWRAYAAGQPSALGCY
jgi:hypothetical protein